MGDAMTARSRTLVRRRRPASTALVLGLGLGARRVRRARRRHDHGRAAGHGRGLGARRCRRDRSASEIYERASKAVVEISADGCITCRRSGASAGIRLRLRHERAHRDQSARRRRRVVDLGELLERRRARRRRSSEPIPRPISRFSASTTPDQLLVPLRLADSSTVEVGDPVLAFGSPFGLEGHDHQRHRQRASSRDDCAEQLHDHRHDPDRRGDQPRKLGRPAPRPPRTRHRRQRADRERVGRLGRRRLRDPLEHRCARSCDSSSRPAR